MKQAWRFVKWCIGGIGWFEAFLTATCIALLTGIIAGDGMTRNIAWGFAVGLNVLAMFVFIGMGVRYQWGRFKEDDERVFNILKDKNDGR